MKSLILKWLGIKEIKERLEIAIVKFVNMISELNANVVILNSRVEEIERVYTKKLRGKLKDRSGYTKVSLKPIRSNKNRNK